MAKFFIVSTEADFSTRKGTITAPSRQEAIERFATTGSIDRCVETGKAIAPKFKDGRGGTIVPVGGEVRDVELEMERDREQAYEDYMVDTGRFY
jgi:hypothetical protein